MFVKSACVWMIMVMNWSLELLVIFKNYELKFGTTFDSQKLLFQNQFYTFLWGFLSSKIFIHISMHALSNFITKKILCQNHGPWTHMIFNHEFSNIYSKMFCDQYLFISSCQHLCFVNFFVGLFCSDLFVSFALWFFCEFCYDFVSNLFVEEEEKGPQWTTRGGHRSGPQNEQ